MYHTLTISTPISEMRAKWWGFIFCLATKYAFDCNNDITNVISLWSVLAAPIYLCPESGTVVITTDKVVAKIKFGDMAYKAYHYP